MLGTRDFMVSNLWASCNFFLDHSLACISFFFHTPYSNSLKQYFYQNSYFLVTWLPKIRVLICNNLSLYHCTCIFSTLPATLLEGQDLHKQQHNASVWSHLCLGYYVLVLSLTELWGSHHLDWYKHNELVRSERERLTQVY